MHLLSVCKSSHRDQAAKQVKIKGIYYLSYYPSSNSGVTYKITRNRNEIRN